MKVNNVLGKMIVIALVTLGAFAILVYYYGAAGGRLPNAENRYTVNMVLSEPQQVLKHADVRAAGIKVGEVVNIKDVGRRAKITIDLEKEIAPIYNDATVLVRQKTLVGENFIEVKRGTPSKGELPDGGTLPDKAALESVPIDRILNSLDEKTRKGISTNLRALGGGFKDHGDDFNAFAEALVPLVSEGTQVTDILNAQSKQVADIIQQGNTVFTALADRREDLKSLLKSATTTAKTVSERDQQLGQAFKEFPSTLSQARGTVTRLASFSGRAVPVVSDLKLAAKDLAPVLKDLGPTATQADRVFDELPRFTNQADPLLKQLTSFSKVAAPTFPALDATLRQANPFLRFLMPYNRDVGNTLSVFGSNTYYDKYGAQGKCVCIFGTQSFANYTPALRQAAAILLDQGIIRQAYRVHNNQYRKPGTALDGESDFSGDYPNIEADK